MAPELLGLEVLAIDVGDRFHRFPADLVELRPALGVGLRFEDV
jgi:hypothetical protein